MKIKIIYNDSTEAEILIDKNPIKFNELQGLIAKKLKTQKQFDIMDGKVVLSEKTEGNKLKEETKYKIVWRDVKQVVKEDTQNQIILIDTLEETNEDKRQDKVKPQKESVQKIEKFLGNAPDKIIQQNKLKNSNFSQTLKKKASQRTETLNSQPDLEEEIIQTTKLQKEKPQKENVQKIEKFLGNAPDKIMQQNKEKNSNFRETLKKKANQRNQQLTEDQTQQEAEDMKPVPETDSSANARKKQQIKKKIIDEEDNNLEENNKIEKLGKGNKQKAQEDTKQEDTKKQLQKKDLNPKKEKSEEHVLQKKETIKRGDNVKQSENLKEPSKKEEIQKKELIKKDDGVKKEAIQTKQQTKKEEKKDEKVKNSKKDEILIKEDVNKKEAILRKQSSNNNEEDQGDEFIKVEVQDQKATPKPQAIRSNNKPPIAHGLEGEKSTRKRIMSEVQRDTKTLSQSQTRPILQSPENSTKAQELVRRMNDQRSEQEKKKQKDRQLIDLLSMKENQVIAQREQEVLQARLEKRKQIQDKLEEENKLKEYKAKLNQDGNKLIKQIQDQIKEKEIQKQKREESLIMPDLEKRKAELARKRELSQPIRLDELKQHQKKYEEDSKQKMFERQLQKQEAFLEHKAKVIKFPKSQAQLRVEEEERMEKEKRNNQLDAKRQQRQRQMKYTEVVKDIFPVKQVNQTFTEDITVKKDNYHLSKGNSQSPLIVPAKRELSSMDMKGYIVGDSNLRRLERVLNKNAKTRNQIQSANQDTNLRREDNTKQLNNQKSQDINFFSHTDEDKSMVQQPQQKPEVPHYIKEKRIREANKKNQLLQQQQLDQPPPKPPRIDYLLELRTQRQTNQVEKPQEEWQNIKRIIKNDNLNSNAKYQNVLNSVQMLEQRAKQKEKLATHNKNQDAEEEANNLYINSIKAKLALLENQ